MKHFLICLPLALLAPVILLAQQNITVSGVIFDEYGMPLPGATVIEVGTVNGVSTDFDGSDVLAANWDKINVTIPGEDVSWYAFQDVGLVDVSSYTGNLYVAFKYVGSGNDTSLDGGYFVDDVLFLKQ